jgi:hypothetical protein
MNSEQRHAAAITADDIQWELAPIDKSCRSTSLDELLIEAICENAAYRLLAQAALHVVHEVMLERDILREQRRIDRRLASGQAA